MTKDVDKGMQIQSTQGPSLAWNYMQYCRVPQEVILRVLMEQDLREKPDSDFEFKQVGTVENDHVIRLWRRCLRN
jgi:hypothetical protein